MDVVVVDNVSTGQRANVPSSTRPNCSFLDHDVTQPFRVEGSVDMVFHFASPASPPDYLEHPIETLDVGSIGTRNLLELALGKGARFFLASTSEVYGDPLVHPQTEVYWGNVNPVGPRSVYDEAKRFAEALTMAYHRARGLEVRIVRIFQYVRAEDAASRRSSVPNFIDQSLRDEPLTVYGDGSQTRSLCYVDDLINGVILLAHSDILGPVNIGNPEELKIFELAQTIVELTKSSSELIFRTPG